jgi:hypothetical protein
LLCSLRHYLPSSPTTSFLLYWRVLSLLYETRATPERVLNCRAVYQGQPRMKHGLCLALVGALELLSAVDWKILVFQPKCRIMIFKSTQKDTQPSQTCSGGHITPIRPQNRCGWCLFAYGEYKLDKTRESKH